MSVSRPDHRAVPLRVLLSGPIAVRNRAATGGYAAANRRTADALARRGVGVSEVSYPVDALHGWRKLEAYAVAFLRTWRAVLRADTYDVLHMTPLNMQFALAELVTLQLARWVRRPVLFDIRAGTFDTHFAGRSPLYRWAIVRSLRLATRVAIEGTRYAPLVTRLTGAAPWYFPNYVETAALAPATATRTAPGQHAFVRLLYVGRVVEAKGIDTALETLRLLVQQGIAATLNIVGTGDTRQMDAWKLAARELPVKWSGALAPTEVMRVAATSHFFLFPSRHAGEGHSNALNEAMAAGVVPVASDQGFSRDVIGDTGVVLPVSAAAAEYAAAIVAILREHRWRELSRNAHRRVTRAFSEQVLLPPLIELYEACVGRRDATTADAPVPRAP